jgi:hypothetical protein
MKKLIKKGLCALIVTLLITSTIPAHASNDYSIKKFVNTDLLRADGNYYRYVFSDYTEYSGNRAMLDIIDINKNGHYITSDNVLHFRESGEDLTIENALMVSDADINGYFYYLDTDGNLHHFWREYIKRTDTIVAEDLGAIKELNLKYALCENGDLYQLNEKDTKLVDTSVKKVTLFDNDNDFVREALYLKNDGSLYSYSFNDKVSKHLLDDITFYEVFLDSDFCWQIRATAKDNTRYKWGNNEYGQIYKDIVDGNNIAPKYVSTPMKITDNIVYQDNLIVLQADGKLFRKINIQGTRNFTNSLLDTDVSSIRPYYGEKYQYQKFNDDIYNIDTYLPSGSTQLNKPELKCTNAVKGLGINYNSYFIKKDGTLVSDNNIQIKPVKYFKSSAWALPELKEADSLGILKSLDGVNYTSLITRKDFCDVIVDMCESYMGKEMPISSVNPFKDVTAEDNINYDSIMKAYGAGIINGTSADQFSPYLQISREQMAAMMHRAARYLDSSISFGQGVAFADSKGFSSWSVESINAMSAMGIIKGVNGEFKPRDPVTVEQAAAMTLRLYKEIR